MAEIHPANANVSPFQNTQEGQYCDDPEVLHFDDPAVVDFDDPEVVDLMTLWPQNLMTPKAIDSNDLED